MGKSDPDLWSLCIAGSRSVTSPPHDNCFTLQQEARSLMISVPCHRRTTDTKGEKKKKFYKMTGNVELLCIHSFSILTHQLGEKIAAKNCYWTQCWQSNATSFVTLTSNWMPLVFILLFQMVLENINVTKSSQIQTKFKCPLFRNEYLSGSASQILFRVK